MTIGNLTLDREVNEVTEMWTAIQIKCKNKMVAKSI